MGHVAPIVMSAVVFAGAAQFAATAVLADGGSTAAAVVAGILLNLRFIPMGISIAPSLHARVASRAAVGQGLVDASWAMASRGGGRYDVPYMLGATLVQYPAWVAGAAIGVLAGDVIGIARGPRARRDLPRLLPRAPRERAPGRDERRGGTDRRRTRARADAVRPTRRPGAGGICRRGARAGAPMSEVWITIGALAVATAMIKASGPVVFGGRALPEPAMRVISLLAAALLAALVVTQTFARRPGAHVRCPGGRPGGRGRRARAAPIAGRDDDQRGGGDGPRAGCDLGVVPIHLVQARKTGWVRERVDGALR